eukprot:11670825-Alexandrium_andersonii.AAC.1
MDPATGLRRTSHVEHSDMVPAIVVLVQAPRPLFVSERIVAGHDQHVALLETHDQVSVAIRLAAWPPEQGIMIDPVGARRRDRHSRH